jgi:U3 small nucleolar RNA-associated protein 21
MDGLPRIHKARSGHSAPPTSVRFYGSDGRALITASQDKSLRMSSIIRDSQNTELSQGQIQKKAKQFKIKEAELKLNQVMSFSSSKL